MEKIIVTEISDDKFTKPNDKGMCTKFWGCKLTDGRGATIWDEKIANDVKNNLNTECEAEIKTQGSFANIRAFNATNTMTSDNECLEETPKAERVIASAPSVQKSIVAQCLTKCAVGKDGDKCEEVLKAYNYFLKEL